VANKHEFRFVVSGVELSREQQEVIAREVAAAGATALAEQEVAGAPHSSATFIPKEWLGRWLEVLEPSVANEVKGNLGIAESIDQREGL
jgi:hypothetical protein